MRIVKSRHIVHGDANVFNNELTKAIDNFQNMGYKVEIQYSMSNMTSSIIYSALIIARQK